MCFHSVKDMLAGVKRMKNPNIVGVIALVNGKFAEAYHADATDADRVAMAFYCITKWHDKRRQIDLSFVNAKRHELGLDPFTNEEILDRVAKLRNNDDPTPRNLEREGARVS